MKYDKQPASRLRALTAFVLVALSGITGAAASDEAAAVDYEMLVDGALVSVRAVDRPLIQVLQDLGTKVNFDVVSDLGEDVRVTVAFEDRTVEQAVSILCKQVGYLVALDPTTQRIQRLVLTPKKAKVNRTATRQADPPGWRPAQPPPMEPVEETLPQQDDAVTDPQQPGEPEQRSPDDKRKRRGE